MKRKMIYVAVALAIVFFGAAAVTMTARAAYESASYDVVKKDGRIEIRDYPDLMLASTTTDVDAQGRDGSFMRLFRYISGSNESDQKISMTTPVFMDSGPVDSGDRMGFVVPMEVAAAGTPEPSSPDVKIRKRDGGRFAVIRFSGQLNKKSTRQAEARLREWMATKGHAGEAQVESAGYDPPFTPGPLRRNEVLIRLRTDTGADNSY